MNSEQLEKYSSAITLSDMEIFVFPELLYSLVLADIMSPVIWQWRQLVILKGLTPGAALVFLMTGPATNAASFVTIWKSLGSRTAITYLLTVAGCALLGGILLDYIAGGVEFELTAAPGWMLPPVIKYASAVVLLAVLAFAIPSKKQVSQ